MKPRAAREIDIKERIELARTMQTNLMADLAGEGSHYANYSQKLDLYMDSLFGADAIMQRSHVKPAERPLIMQPLALYMEAASRERSPLWAKDLLVERAGKAKAYEIIKNTQAAIDNEHTVLDLLAEYGTAYTETALEIPTHDKKGRMDTSLEAIRDLVGSKHAQELVDIVVERIDMELYDSMIAFSPRPSWEGDIESRLTPKRGRKR